MSIDFIVNNIHFTIELLGALCFFVMAWLAVDAYKAGKHYSLLFRVLGLSLMALWQVVHAFSLNGDIVNFFGFSGYIVGLVFVLASYMASPKMAGLSAILIIPSFAGVFTFFEGVAALLLGAVTFTVYGQMKREHNASLKSLVLGFLFTTIGSILMAVNGVIDAQNIYWYVAHLFEVLGFISFAYWVWQYLRMRIQESLVLIFLTMTIFIATLVTLAFSTILISKVEQQTRNNLLIDAKVFDFTVQNLMDKSGAESKYIATNTLLPNIVSSGDTIRLQTVLTQYLESEKLGFLLATDASGTVIMRAHAVTEYGDSIAYERSVEEALVGNSFTTIEYSPREKFSIRSASPLYKDGKVVGTIVAGFPLDNVMVDGIKNITGLDTTLYQADLVVASTSMSADGRSRLVGVPIEDTTVKNNVLVMGQTVTSKVSISGMPFLASYVPFENTDGKIVGMFSSAKPQSDIVDIANTTNRLTLLAVTVILIILAVPMYLVTKKLLGDSV